LISLTKNLICHYKNSNYKFTIGSPGLSASDPSTQFMIGSPGLSTRRELPLDCPIHLTLFKWPKYPQPLPLSSHHAWLLTHIIAVLYKPWAVKLLWLLILSDGADSKQRTDMWIGATLSCHSMMELTCQFHICNSCFIGLLVIVKCSKESSRDKHLPLALT